MVLLTTVNNLSKNYFVVPVCVVHSVSNYYAQKIGAYKIVLLTEVKEVKENYFVLSISFAFSESNIFFA